MEIRTGEFWEEGQQRNNSKWWFPTSENLGPLFNAKVFFFSFPIAPHILLFIFFDWENMPWRKLGWINFVRNSYKFSKMFIYSTYWQWCCIRISDPPVTLGFQANMDLCHLTFSLEQTVFSKLFRPVSNSNKERERKMLAEVLVSHLISFAPGFVLTKTELLAWFPHQ